MSNYDYCVALAYITIPLLFCYWFLEVHYFLRFSIAAFIARFIKKRTHVLEETYYSGICLTTDVDALLFHMNNTRYLREVDFARADFYVRTRLWQAIRANGGSVAQVCTNIRYRRFIRPFSIYTITTKVVYWDHNSIFMEHKFITKQVNFVNAIVMSRQRLIDCNGDEVINSLLSKSSNKVTNGTIIKPELPPEFARWVESNEISSAILRNTDES